MHHNEKVVDGKRYYRLMSGRWISETTMAKRLNLLTDPNHPQFCPEFSRMIRKLRPDWFLDGKFGRRTSRVDR